MTKESYTYQMIANDAELLSLGVKSVYRSNALEDPAEDCFIILVWGTAGPDVRVNRNFVAWVYDAPSDYSRIDSILARLRQLLGDSVGGEVRQYEFFGDSDDLYDDRWQRILRTGSYSAH